MANNPQGGLSGGVCAPYAVLFHTSPSSLFTLFIPPFFMLLPTFQRSLPSIPWASSSFPLLEFHAAVSLVFRYRLFHCLLFISQAFSVFPSFKLLLSYSCCLHMPLMLVLSLLSWCICLFISHFLVYFKLRYNLSPDTNAPSHKHSAHHRCEGTQRQNKAWRVTDAVWDKGAEA